MNFGHHPNPAIDFCVEVEAIEGEVVDQRAGLAAQFDISQHVDRAMQFRVGGDQAAINAKDALRRIASSAA